jgi:hypothetical protein
MKISTGPELFEQIANHPDVYPAVSCKGCGRITFADVWRDCIGLEFGGRGGFIYHRSAPGVYEVHTLFLPGTRGAEEFAALSLRHMFGEVGAELILTMIPGDLPHVRRFALKQGFTKFDEVPGGWERESGPVDLEFFSLTKEAFQCQPQPSAQQ